MATFAELKTELAADLNDGSNQIWTAAEVGKSLNYSLKRLVRYLFELTEWRLASDSVSASSGTQEYDLPSDFGYMRRVYYSTERELYPLHNYKPGLSNDQGDPCAYYIHGSYRIGSHEITGGTQGSKEIEISGDETDYYIAGVTFDWTNCDSATNNTTFTVASSAHSGGTTTVTVSEAIGSDDFSGYITHEYFPLIGFRPIPGSSITINFNYFPLISDMVGDNETPGIPSDFHDLLKLDAGLRLMLRKGRYALYAQWKDLWKERMMEFQEFLADRQRYEAPSLYNAFGWDSWGETG